MCNKKTQLVLFTSDFPFGFLEPFLETEIQYLSKGFDEVIILTSSSSSLIQTRTVPSNCFVERFDLQLNPLQKLLSLFFVLNPLFYSELAVIRKVYKIPISKGIIFTMFISYSRSKKVKKKIEQILTKKSDIENTIFYSYWCDDFAIGLAQAKKKNPKIKTLCRIHRWDVYFEESKFNYLPFRHLITHNIGRIVSISQHGINYAKAVWKTGMDDKFIVSRLGVNNTVTPIFNDKNYLLLVSCSNIIPVKRVHLIAEALNKIENINIKWVHFGDGIERELLESLIENLPSNILVELKGRKNNKEIYNYYTENRPDLFINVSSSEGVPVSIMEAMSFGIPVIAANVGGNGEIVNNENGYLLSEFLNETDVAESIIKFKNLSSHNLMEMRKRSFETWKLEYNAEVNYLNFIKEICSL